MSKSMDTPELSFEAATPLSEEAPPHPFKGDRVSFSREIQEKEEQRGRRHGSQGRDYMGSMSRSTSRDSTSRERSRSGDRGEDGKGGRRKKSKWPFRLGSWSSLTLNKTRSKSPDDSDRYLGPGRLAKSPDASDYESDNGDEDETSNVPIDNAFNDQYEDEEEASQNAEDVEDTDVEPDSVTSKNTEANVLVRIEKDDDPYQMYRSENERSPERLALTTSKPYYERNRCTIILEHGNYEKYSEESNRPRVYLIATDLSDESQYALEWAIGTVLRDGDECIVVSVLEDEAMLDPPQDRPRGALEQRRVENKRKANCLVLSRHVTSLVTETHLHVRISVQAIHAKNARSMLMSLIDYIEPTMVICGSRGIEGLKSKIVLGSTSHALINESSVPVMIVRRKMRRFTPHKHISDLDRLPRVGGLQNAVIDKKGEKTSPSPRSGEKTEADTEAEDGDGDGDGGAEE